MNPKVTLRRATENDLEFLFGVATEAMQHVSERLHPGRVVNKDEELQKYKDLFEPNEVQIIQYKGQDVGRLRVVRTTKSIYVGGIQILPVFQGKGIGGAIFADLIEESKRLGIPVELEVHDVNSAARAFYKKLGFVEAGKQGRQRILKTVIAK